MTTLQGADVHKLIVACDAGMGSSVMLASQLRKLLKPLPGQGADEVKRYAATVMRGLRDALHYDEIEKIFELLED